MPGPIDCSFKLIGAFSKSNYFTIYESELITSQSDISFLEALETT
jgi:hypothetical protein